MIEGWSKDDRRTREGKMDDGEWKIEGLLIKWVRKEGAG
jgi:hypothetical protein